MHCACTRGRPSGLSALTQDCQYAADAMKAFSAAVESEVLLTTTANAASKMHATYVYAFHCIAQPDSTLLDCILYRHNISWIQALYQALHIGASLGISALRIPLYQENDVNENSTDVPFHAICRIRIT